MNKLSGLLRLLKLFTPVINANKHKIKPKKQGKVLWNSSVKGTYIKAKHGELK